MRIWIYVKRFFSAQEFPASNEVLTFFRLHLCLLLSGMGMISVFKTQQSIYALNIIQIYAKGSQHEKAFSLRFQGTMVPSRQSLLLNALSFEV